MCMQTKAPTPRPPRMVRKQYLLTPDQSRRLRACAESTGLTEAEIVRHGIDLALDQPPVPADDWRSYLKQVLDEFAVDGDFADRMSALKSDAAKAWRARIEGNRLRIDDT